MIARSAERDRSRRGFALVAVLWVVTIAGLILIGVQKATRATLAAAFNELGSVRAHWLARAGVEQGLAVLEDDDPGVDSADDLWYADEISFEDQELTGGQFSVTAPPPEGSDPRLARYGLIDHCARLNLNTADEKQLAGLGILTESQAAAILDWRDGDEKVRPGGAERGEYQRLPFPYEIRNGPLRTIPELRLIRDIDDETFRGEDANLNGRLDANEDDRSASFPNDDGNGELRPGLASLTTIYSYEVNADASGNERLNVNTADKKTLMERLNFSEPLAEAVVKHGSGAKGGNGKKGAKRFNSLMDLLDVKAQQQKKDSGSTGSAETGKVTEITLKWLAGRLDELTVSDEKRLPGRINVNTAPRAVLLSLPEMTPEAADAILDRRSSVAGPFQAVGELLTDGVVKEKLFKRIAESLTVRSAVFEIRSTAVTQWGIRHTIVAIVDRGANPMRILYWHQSE